MHATARAQTTLSTGARPGTGPMVVDGPLAAGDALRRLLARFEQALA